MNKIKNIYKTRIDKVIEYVNKNLHKSFSLGELADVAHFSSYHFHRIFMAMTGETINNFTNRLRLEKSARLLKYSKLTVTQSAFNCGFSSSSTFSRSFKQHFGISPSAYKKSGKLLKSKICKELFPIHEYILPMNIEELNENFPVTVKEYPQRYVAFIRVSDAYSYGLVKNAYNKLIHWAMENNILESAEIFGMSLDDPMVTPKEKYRYECCITIPDSFQITEENEISRMVLPKCSYAVTHVSGDLKMVATANYHLFNNWLINSNYEPEHLPMKEVFLDKENINNWNQFDLEICMPVKKQ